jgi:[acyl-carrier-protein] S-malonyltransferase
MTLIYMFPGQSSRYPGMIPKLAGLHPRNREVLEASSDILGRDLAAHYAADNPDAYGCNRDVQIGVFLTSHMFLQLLSAGGLEAEASLGLSLGEWNHLVHIEALPFREALLAVEQRGRAYDSGPRGAMASAFPIGAEELREVARQASDRGVVEVVNLNSPRQQVLSGEAAAIERAVELLEEEHFINAVIIERQVPMHCSIFAPVGTRFREYLQGVPFARPARPYVPNRLAQILTNPEPKQLVELLSTHVHQPVLWQASVDLVLEHWPDAVLVEVGPKTVLYNLLDKKWHRDVRKYHTDTVEHTADHVAQLVASLREHLRAAA